jgi:hypothetical protein
LQKAKMEQIRTMVLANCLTIPGIKPGQWKSPQALDNIFPISQPNLTPGP